MTKRLCIFISLLLCALTTFAQWNTIPGGNTLVQSVDGHDVYDNFIAKNPDGSIYILSSHYSDSDKRTFYYLQLVDINGVKQFGEDGLIVSEYDTDNMIYYSNSTIVSDDEGNAIVAIPERQDGNSNLNSYFTIYKFSPDGEKLWGENGTVLNRIPQLADLRASMNILKADDGSFIFSYTTAATRGNITVEIERLNAEGEFMWDAPLVITNQSGFVLYSWLLPADDDKFNIVYSMNSDYDLAVRQYNLDGDQTWTDDVIIYDGGFDDAPIYLNTVFDADGKGGFFAAWRYTLDPETSSVFKAQIANVGIDGSYGIGRSEKGGLALDTTKHANSSVVIAYNPTNDCVMACYPETVGLVDNLVLQKIDSNGNRVWSEEGKRIETFKNQNLIKCRDIEVTPSGDFLILYTRKTEIETNDEYLLYAAVVSGEDGSMLWEEPLLVNSEPESVKCAIITTISDKYCIVSWRGNRTSNHAIYMQPVYFNGTYDGVTSVDDVLTEATSPLSVSYDNGTMVIDVETFTRGNINVRVFNADGRLITGFSKNDAAPDHYQYRANPSPGFYIVELTADGECHSAKCVIY